MNTQRIKELEKQKRAITEELKLLKDMGRLVIENAEKLVYPFEYGRRIEVRYIPPSRIGDVVRQIITPKRDQRGMIGKKNLTDLTEEEHRIICRCVEECIDVIDKYNKILNPYGINEGGRYTSDEDFFRRGER